MKAIVQDSYGGPEVLELRDIDMPEIGDGDVLVRVRAAGLDPGVWHLMTGPRQNLRMFIARATAEDLEYLKELIEAGQATPVIDRTYPLSKVPEAIRYLEQEHARGKIVLTV
jgi:NADPH:quinone reductase-like Zn-dependent oxidoreductase